MVLVESSYWLILRRWRIQNFPEVGAPTPKVVVKYFLASFSTKNCMELKEFGAGRGGGASMVSTIRSANGDLRMLLYHSMNAGSVLEIP